MINTHSLNRLMAELNAINWSFIDETETDAQLGYTDYINIGVWQMHTIYICKA